jgi:hypothetical protein
MNDDYLFPDSESGSNKKSRFERDLERFGSASAVKAAKVEAEEAADESGGTPKRKKGGAAAVAAALGVERTNVDDMEADALLDPPPDEEVHFSESSFANPYAPKSFDAAEEQYGGDTFAGEASAGRNSASAESGASASHAKFAGIAEEIEAEFRDAFGSSALPSSNADPIASAAEESVPEIARRHGRRRGPFRPMDDDTKSEMFTPLSPEEYAKTADLIKQVESSAGSETDADREKELETVVKLQPVPPDNDNSTVFSRTAINDGSYDLENEIRTGTLPVLGDINDDLSVQEDGKVRRSTKSDDDIAKIRKSDAAALNALSEKEKEKDIESAPRITFDAAAQREKKSIRLGRILLYVSNALSVIIGIAGIMMFPDIEPLITYLFYGFIIVGALGFVPFRFMQKVVALICLALIFLVVVMGIIGTAYERDMTKTIFFAVMTGVGVYGFSIQAFSFDVKRFYRGPTM